MNQRACVREALAPGSADRMTVVPSRKGMARGLACSAGVDDGCQERSLPNLDLLERYSLPRAVPAHLVSLPAPPRSRIIGHLWMSSIHRATRQTGVRGSPTRTGNQSSVSALSLRPTGRTATASKLRKLQDHLLYSSPATVSPRGPGRGEPPRVVLAQSATFAPSTTANRRMAAPPAVASSFGGCPLRGARLRLGPRGRLRCAGICGTQAPRLVPVFRRNSAHLVRLFRGLNPGDAPSIPGRHFMAALLFGSGTASSAEHSFVSRTF